MLKMDNEKETKKTSVNREIVVVLQRWTDHMYST